MQPVISPWIIYLIGISSNVSAFCLIFGGIGLFVFCVGALAHGLCEYDSYENHEKNRFRRIVMSGVAVFAFIIGVGVLVPSRSTAIAMLVAHNVTYERLEALPDPNNLREAVKQDILDIIEEVKK